MLGPVTRSCWAFLRDRLLQRPRESLHPERRVSFPLLSWDRATWKVPGPRRGDAVGTQPRWRFLAGPPPLSRHDHWPRAAHSCPLLQRVARARLKMPLLGGAHLLVPHHPGSPHTMTERPGVHQVRFASIWNQPWDGRILCSRVPVGSDRRSTPAGQILAQPLSSACPPQPPAPGAPPPYSTHPESLPQALLGGN